MSDRYLSMAEIKAKIEEEPIGFALGSGKVWLPANGHAHHRYDARCVICRAGDIDQAFTTLVNRIVNLAAPLPDPPP